jgi:uncharacterized protein YodC (DUF2158 family)
MNKGNLVKLNSGSPVMTVVSLWKEREGWYADDIPMATCQWVDANGVSQTYDFPTTCLTVQSFGKLRLVK